MLRATLRIFLLAAFFSTAFTLDAQQPRTYRIGVLSPDALPPGVLEEFKEGLREHGYLRPTKPVDFVVRHADGKMDRLAALADEVVSLRVDVIFAMNTPAALAAKKATATIPIVVTRVTDPLKSGLVASLSRPGGNITGLSFIPESLSGKRLELLKESIPSVRAVAALWTAENPGATVVVDAMELPSKRLGMKLLRMPLRDAKQLAGLVEAASRNGAGAIIVVDDAFVTRHRTDLVTLAGQHLLPVFSLFEPVAEAGGLMAYGPSTVEMYRRPAHYVDRILRGERPGELPIEQPARFHLAINMKAAQALGLTIPEPLRLRADRLIQ